ncbi:flagellar M-ring protein FliF, partial [bacterium AH-315-J21]|nr:flagellar M-ring protein FliF [bacterium AH-315-J21]
AAGEALAYLEANKIPYQVSEGGRSIMIPDGDVHRVRMAMASEGVPTGGSVGYAIFDKTNFGMTDFLQKVNFRRALEGELTKTILEIREVKAARVHIVMPKERLFGRDKKETTASILLKLSSGSLSRSQLAGINHLVASSVEGLQTENISIIDYNGNLLSDAKGKNTMAGLSSTQLQVRKDVESYLEEKAQSMLDGVIGVGKSVVRVSAELDFTQSERTNELYDANGAVVRSEERSEQTNNSKDQLAEKDSESTDDSKVESTITNYEIPKTIEHIVNHVGGIKRISVAVMLDGKTEFVDDGDGNLVESYTPRAQEEIDRLSGIVKSSIGFDSDRNDQMEVYNMPFDNSAFKDMQNELDKSTDIYMYVDLVKRFGGWLLIAFAIMYFRKKASKLFVALKKIVPPPAPKRVEPEHVGPIVDEPASFEMERRTPKLIDQMQETAKEKPEELAKVIKTMMVGNSE